MKLKVFKALWGDAQGDATRADLQRIRNAGYDGVEWSVPKVTSEQWKDWCREVGLEFIGMAFALTAEEVRPALEEIARYGPEKVTMHSGRDKMTEEEGLAFLSEALKVERDLGVPVAHETHRHRLFFTPWTTVRYLDKLPELKLCLDMSHWCCVTESLLKDMEEWVTRACERTIHIHGRVGWEESAQVADPRAPEAQHYVERHEEVWDRVWEAHQAAGADALSFNPEYGPPGYMPALPFTRQPVTNLWDICLWQAERARRRWTG